ncbi:conserved Plasmodium protein, unknown function [Plasmodium chabaudi chabaudi]|uniref:Uncharacterized protein n=1 Tax=Plasmodium chabaudi chabaudi TaxID=31271 RepID=A0A1D3RSV8_PLACU|nr:conserved Plasmodium protein, unknown function [Plasmodium chabaudi chabaudi]
MRYSYFIWALLLILSENISIYALKCYNRHPVKTYILVNLKGQNNNFVGKLSKNEATQNRQKELHLKKKKKVMSLLRIKGNKEDDITYEDIEEYLKNEDVNNSDEDDGRKEIMKLINYIPTLKNEEEFFSKYGYKAFNSKRGNKNTIEYYLNEMKILKEKKEKKNYNILNWILSCYLKRQNDENNLPYNKYYQNIQSYYNYINSLISHQGGSLSSFTDHPDKKENIFYRTGLCHFLSFYLKNVNILKYGSFFCLSGMFAFLVKGLIRNIKFEDMFLLQNYFKLIYSIKNLSIYKIGAFSILLNSLFLNKYNQYFSISNDLFGMLFTNYFFYEGINNLTKKKIEDFMDKYNCTKEDIFNSLNDLFSQFLNKQIYVEKEMDEKIIYNISSFIKLYKKLFINNIDNIKNITSLVLNKYNVYYASSENINKTNSEVLSRICYIFYIINILLKHSVSSLQNVNLMNNNEYNIPMFKSNNKLSNYFLLTSIKDHLMISEKVISDCILDQMKKNYEKHISSLIKNKNMSTNIFDDIKKLDFLILDKSIISEVNLSIFNKLVNDILEQKKYDKPYFKHSKLDTKSNDDFNNVKDNINKETSSTDPLMGDSERDEDDKKSTDDDDGDVEKYYSENTKYEEEEETEDIGGVDSEIYDDNEGIDERMYKYIEDSVDYIVEGSVKKDENNNEKKSSKGKDNNNKNDEEEKKELETLLKKIKDIHSFRKYLSIPKEFVDNQLEKYLFPYMNKEYKIFLNNLIFKNFKNKNENLFFLKNGITLSSGCTENIIKNIILDFVIKTKENVSMFFKLNNIDKCLKLVLNLFYVYKRLKKKRKYIKTKNMVLNLEKLFSHNSFKSQASGKQETPSETTKTTPLPDYTNDPSVLNNINNTKKNNMGDDVAKEDDIDSDMSFPNQNEEFLCSDNFEGSMQEEEEGEEILSLDERKRLYEIFVLKYMQNKSERNIFKKVFKLDNIETDKEVEDNIIKKFLEKAVKSNLESLKKLDNDYGIISNENLFNYKNLNFIDKLEKAKKSKHDSNVNINKYIIKKDDIFEYIDDESFEDICKKMYINKLLLLKDNLYNNRKDLYLYEIILNINNSEGIHDIYLIDQYEKMINDIIKTNLLNKNYTNIKNMYLKKIINFLNISEQKATDVELRCIYDHIYSIFLSIKENFYIYKTDLDFFNNINEILTIYNNYDLIKKNGDGYLLKFALIETNHNLLQKLIERYVLYVIDIINNENKLTYKENIFKLAKILNVNNTIISDIAAKIYKKYIENQELHSMNNMDVFFNFLFNMDKGKQVEIIFDYLRQKVQSHLNSNENYQEKLQKLYDLLNFINNNLKLNKNIFDFYHQNEEIIYEFLISCIDDYLDKKKSTTFISSQSEYMMHFNNFLSKIKMLIKGPKENSHFTHVLNILKKSIIKKAISFMENFKYDLCVEKLYNFIKLQMVDSTFALSDIDIEQRKKMINIFSYQNIDDEKKHLYMDILNKALL